MRNNTKNLRLNKPGLFTPTVIRGIKQGANTQTVSFGSQENELVASNVNSTSSFKYSIQGEGLRSTQQINVDYTKFENHTFFNSAQVKTNVAFNKIFNEFPFDGTKKEFESFFDSLTGFEKYVYDSMPKHTGYLFFSGTNEPEATGGTYITVKDIAGANFPNISRLRTGETIINPGLDSMTIEMQLFVPLGPNSASMILDKHIEPAGGTKDGFSLGLEATGSGTTGSISLFILSGTIYDRVNIDFQKGKFNHIAYTWDRTPGIEKISGYLNQSLFASSSQAIEFHYIDTLASDLLVGSGSIISGLFTPTTTFSGAIDELRLWKTVRPIESIKLFKEKAVFAEDDLKLYFKFNEPSGSNSPLVIDCSKNSLHGTLNASAILLGVREIANENAAGVSPITFEKINDAPILFPTHPDILDLQSELLSSASLFDRSNPNIITRLVPVHYFLEGQEQDAISTEEGEIVKELQAGADPRTVKLGGTQTLLLLLYTWAKFFDEMKLYLQTMSTLISVDYDSEDTIPDQFLSFMARQEGIELPPLFEGSSIEQFLEAENVQSDISTNSNSLQDIQNKIWRRVLINLQDIIRSKGTIHAVKSFIRSVGIDPDNNFRIREFGGPTRRPLTFAREKRSEISSMINFVSGGILQSPFLSGSRVEPGFPWAVGDLNDGLFTSGSWTYEATYKIPQSNQGNTSQSLVRLQTTGALSTTGLLANVVTVRGGNTTLFIKNQLVAPTDELELAITGADLFDGEQWYVSFGRRRSDDGLNSTLSSSYFLRVVKQNFGEIVESYATSSFYNDHASGFGNNLWTRISSQLNASGSYLMIGSQSLDVLGSSLLLNGNNLVGTAAQHTDFSGRVGHIRFYSKYLSDSEYLEHVRNYRSVGVDDPAINFNFNLTSTGSWQRLRIDASSDQPITESNISGEIFLTDFTQNNFTLSGSGFPAAKSIIEPEKFFYSFLSPKFDEAATTEKVRIRSFLEFENVQQTPWAQVGPLSDIERSELPTDNTRFTIDFSVADALNQDIITIFSSLDSLDNIIGSPELLFSPDYPELENLRNIYFNKLTSKMNLKLFFEFFKWFDSNLGTFISQLLPRKTKFLGTNYVIESHLLERPRVEYQFADIYLGDNNRHSLRDTILLRLLTGVVGR